MHLFLQVFCVGDNTEPISAMLFLLVDNVNTFVSFFPPVFHSRGDWYIKRILTQVIGSKTVKK